MQLIDDSGSSPSFNCYNSDSITSTAITKVIREDQQASQFHETEDVQNGDFEFSLTLINENASIKQIDSQNWTVFPIFNRNLLLNNDEVVDPVTIREINATDDEINASFSVTVPLGNLFVDDPDESSSSSYSSSEVDELENLPSGTFCVWRPKTDGETESSPVMSVMTKCKKSSSTGSGSKRWRIRYLLRRSNSEGKEPVVVLGSKKVDGSKVKRSSGEVSKVAGRWKAETPVHERFYVQRRAENEVVKRKSYLPYRKDLVGLFGNVNGMGKMLPF